MKYIVKKVIKNNPYYYLQYGKYTRNLGPALPQNLKVRFSEFFNDIAIKESRFLPLSATQFFKFSDLKELEFAHYRNICMKHELFSQECLNFKTEFAKLFTYHSNHSEGSKVTKKEIDDFTNLRIRKPKTKTFQEIFNSYKALDFAFNEMSWNLKNIKKIHKLLLTNLDPIIAGKWKPENNVAPHNQPTSDFKDVPKKMTDLLNWVKKSFKKHIYPPIIAIEFYCKFEGIHPFLDGNGRVGRILLNAILNKYNYPPVVFFTQNHEEHSSAIRQALDGRKTKIAKHFIGQILKTYKELEWQV